MTTLVALVLAASLTATTGVSGQVGAPSGPEPAAETSAAPAPQPEPDRAAINRMKRSKERRAAINLVGGMLLELGAGLLYVGTYGFIDRDLQLTSEGCNAPDMPCRGGTPVVLLIPAGAVAMGWAGANRFAASREANIWRSPVFWLGTGTLVAPRSRGHSPPVSPRATNAWPPTPPSSWAASSV